MGFAPTAEQNNAYNYAGWHEKGVAQIPSWGGARDTYWTNVGRGFEILSRIAAVGGASSPTELRRKELEQSPAYIAQQKEIARLAEIARVAEIARLTLIEKNDFIALELWTKINNKKIGRSV